MTIRLYAPAKINLRLKVLAKRDDGYHQIDTVMQSISLSDEITIDVAEEGLTVIGPPHLPQGRGNLCYRAAQAFCGVWHVKGGLRIHLNKYIPVQAGLGGGSSDAAAVLVGLNRLFGQPLGLEELTKLAAALGSDVPFFLYGGTARATGRGEVIEPLDDAKPWWLRIIKPPYGLSTPEVYSAWRRGVVVGRDEFFENDLEEAAQAIRPELKFVKQALMDDGAVHAFLCGSGSAVCGLYARRPEGTLLNSSDHKEYVARTITRKEYMLSTFGREC